MDGRGWVYAREEFKETLMQRRRGAKVQRGGENQEAKTGNSSSRLLRALPVSAVSCCAAISLDGAKQQLGPTDAG